MKGEKSSDRALKKFLRRHGKAALLMVVIGILASIAGSSVYFWVIADAQATGLVPAMLCDWTVGHVMTFALALIMWELILVATWVIPVVVIIYFQWYKKLPDEERAEYKGKARRRKSAGEGGIISFFAGLVWLVVVWFDGKWNLPFRSWSFNDLVYSWVTAYLWMLVIIGIPGLIYLIWYLTKK